MTVGLWVVSVAVAGALRHRRLLALHGLVAAATLTGAVTISRIYGVPWHYLMLWGYGIGVLMLLAIGATAMTAVARRRPELASTRAVAVTGLVGIVIVGALSLRMLVLAPDAQTGTPNETAQLGRIVPDTVAALESGVGVATGTGGRYLVHWDDAINGGSEGIGMVNELVRRGFDVSVGARDAVKIGPHRVRSTAEVTATVVVASGGWIERWATVPGAVRVAYDDPRTAAERREFARVRAEAVRALERAGRADLVPRLDTDLFSVALNEHVSVEAGLVLGRMIDLGLPVAVFVAPAGASA